MISQRFRLIDKSCQLIESREFRHGVFIEILCGELSYDDWQIAADPRPMVHCHAAGSD